MKITLDLNNDLFEEVARFTVKHQTTFQAVIETALQNFLRQNIANLKSFRMRRATFSGNVLQSEIEEGNWSQICSQIYEGQGG
ncbi:MAG: hypothetical protein JNM60_02905 [Candidatus Competibacteraceae bacterium]|nr:hypothetical protein [Candidatus Competibacteraceae bacterium]